MNVLPFALGAFVLFVVVTDILWTTLWVQGGAGPLTSRTMGWIWRGLRRIGSPNSRLLTLAGPAILVFSLTVWVLLLWGGWTLVFASADGAVVDTVAGRGVSWSELLYFSGYTVFTLGLGDFVPRSGVWQVVTVVASASGLLFITLSVTYVLSVLGAVTQKRTAASSLTGLGTRGTDVLRRSWDGESFRGLDVPLVSVARQLDTLTSNHRAYPVLHYFYSEDPEQSPSTGIVVLDEALMLLAFGVSGDDGPSDVAAAQARSSVERYLDTLDSTYFEPAERVPPPPDVAELREAGIPTVSDEQFSAAIADQADRRRTLLGLLESDARQWPSDRGE